MSDRTDTVVRYSDVFIGGPFGKIAIGKRDGAANSAFEAYGLLNYLGGGEAYLLFAGVTDVGYRTIDGISRQNRIRYDTPKFGGLSLSLSADSGDANEFALCYAADLAGGKFDTRLGLVDLDSGDITSSSITSSIAYKHGTGFGLSYSFGEDENPLSERETNWLMASYTIDITTLSIGAGEQDVSTITDDEGNTTAVTGTDEMNIIGLNVKPTPGMEIYLNYMDFENRDGSDDDAWGLGARIKF